MPPIDGMPPTGVRSHEVLLMLTSRSNNASLRLRRRCGAVDQRYAPGRRRLLGVQRHCTSEADLVVEELLDVLQGHALGLRDVGGYQHPEKAEEAEDEKRVELNGIEEHRGELGNDEVAHPIGDRGDTQRAGTIPRGEDLRAVHPDDGSVAEGEIEHEEEGAASDDPAGGLAGHRPRHLCLRVCRISGRRHHVHHAHEPHHRARHRHAHRAPEHK
mmetsp:Transcript_99221/g.286282  ORF Transcript_99221/g.286282 Transcript_99221/m.286282 type:complete len:215 (-) Transcript_99221:1196-1840(-)